MIRRVLAAVVARAALGLGDLAGWLGGAPRCVKDAGQATFGGRITSAPGGAGNTFRGLTHSLDPTKEELA